MFVGLCLGSLLCVTPPATAYSRWDESGPFLTGNLTWSGSQRHITWGPATSAQDDQPPSTGDDVTAKQRELAIRRPDIFGNPSVPEPDVFTSDPVPTDLYLNVSRAMQLQLALKERAGQAKPCTYTYVAGNSLTSLAVSPTFDPLLNIKITAGPDVVGYARGDDPPYFGFVHPTHAAPTNPAGYGWCFYGATPEMSIIPKGTVLTVAIIHGRQIYDWPMGFAGDHQSTFRIPLYPAEEIAYRYPELLEAPADAEAAGDDATSTQSGAWAAAPLALGPLLAGLSLASSQRRRGLTLLVLLIFLAAGMSGCLAGKGKDDSNASDADPLKGNLDSTLVRDIGVGDARLGSVLGQVHDDLHIPIAGVHVSIIGLGNFTESDGKGRFQFLNLVPATYKLRFDKKEYRSFEADVDVKAGFITRPNVMLYLVNPKDRDSRPHSHDYWNGQATKDIAPFELSETCAGSPAACTTQVSWRILPKGDDPNTILPGTRDVIVKLSWTPTQLKAEKLGLYVKGNYGFYQNGYFYNYNASYFAPRGPGEPFRIPTAWEGTDVGHQPYSTWDFQWFVAPQDAPSAEDRRAKSLPDYHPGAITVKTSLVRGALPLEPSHPDLWKGASKIEVLKAGNLYASVSPDPPAAGLPQSCVATCTGYHNYPYVPYYPALKLIPFDATTVEVKFHQTKKFNPDFHWNLLYKPANQPYDYRNSQSGEGYKTIDRFSISSDGLTTTWKIPITYGEGDFEYSRASNWAMVFHPDDENAWWLDYNSNQGYVSTVGSLTGQGYQTYTLDVTALK